VLYRSSSDAHGMGPPVEPGAHGLDHRFMLTPLDAPLDVAVQSVFTV
jgi:hypothetical protein